jgi:hypothetical protein
MKENLMEQLKSQYVELVKKGLLLQQEGDMQAFALNAQKKEQVAEKMQHLSRAR